MTYGVLFCGLICVIFVLGLLFLARSLVRLCRGKILEAAAYFVLGGSLFGLMMLFPNMMFSSGHKMLSVVCYDEYQRSECAKWIAIPPVADKITVFRFLGFDTNYRFLKCTVGQSDPILIDLISQSLVSQPRHTNDTFVLVEDANITFDKFVSVFIGPSSERPSWWKTDFAKFDMQSFCAWQDNDYGYGYIYLFDSKQKELRAFQWSQQHNTVEYTRNKFKN